MKNLPNLTGSEKQVKWANDIRKEFVERLEAYAEIVSKQQEQWTAIEAKSGWKNATDEERKLKSELALEQRKLDFIIEKIAFVQYSGNIGKLKNEYYQFKKEFDARGKELKAQGVNEWQREISIRQQNIELATKFAETQTESAVWIQHK